MRHPARTAPIAVLVLAPVLLAGCADEAREDRADGAPADSLAAVRTAADTTGRAARLDVPDVLDTAKLPAEVLETETGEATFYADVLEGRTTASGERLDQSRMVAAHRSYPFGTRLRVIDPATDRDAEVRVIDRGPYARGRSMPAVIDLSKAAARELGILRQGRAVVTVEVLEWGDDRAAGS